MTHSNKKNDIMADAYDNPDFCLADAIVLKACKDYYRSLVMLYKLTGNIDISYRGLDGLSESISNLAKRYISLRNECESFFKSDSIFLVRYSGSVGISSFERVRKQVNREIDNGKISFKYEA